MLRSATGTDRSAIGTLTSSYRKSTGSNQTLIVIVVQASGRNAKTQSAAVHRRPVLNPFRWRHTLFSASATNSAPARRIRHLRGGVPPCDPPDPRAFAEPAVFSRVTENEQTKTSARELPRCTGTATPAQTALEVLVFLRPSEPTLEASSSTPRGLQHGGHHVHVADKVRL
jgi:hypothetical protein